VRDHDPREALDGGADGLDFYRRLTTEAAPWLKPGGRLMIEHGDGQRDSIAALLTQHGWTTEKALDDYSGRGRILIARRKD
jgi:release factor glutamine methyltransferase